MSVRGDLLQFCRFASVGLLNSAVQYAVFLALFHGLHVQYLLASTIGYCVGMVNSYVMNRRWTFLAQGRGTWVQMRRFVAVNAVALATNALLLFVLVNLLGRAPARAQLVAMAATVILGFLLNKHWTFADDVER